MQKNRNLGEKKEILLLPVLVQFLLLYLVTVPHWLYHALADSQIGIFMKNAFLFIFILAQLALFIVFSTYKRSEVGLFHFSRSLKAILTTLLLAASF